MKKSVLLIFLTLILFGCKPTKSSLSVSFKNRNESAISSASVSSVQVVNHQLIVHGAHLNNVTAVKVNGNSLNENFTIESQTATKIIANSIHNFSFDVSKVFNLILSDANASATFQIDFSLCNATLGTAGFDCTAPINNDVLAFDQPSNTWVPRALSGLSYRGVWDANTTEPVSTIIGQYYIVNAANAPTYQVGDWIVWNGSAYDLIAQSAAGGVSTVFGRPGAVVATEADYTLNLLGDVDLSVAPGPGQVLKYIGGKWIADDDDVGSVVGAGSITATELADGSVTDVKIAAVAASKITGSITSAQITDGAIVNADINAAAAIDYSKLNVPAAAIPLTALNATGTKDATKYLKGDDTWAVLTTDVLATALSGLSLTNAVITASDTVLSAFGKLQKQVTDSAVATMSGDLTGTLPSPTVAKIKGVAVSATAPTDGQFLKYTTVGTNWVPSLVTVTDLKSTALGNLFPGTGCAANQTLYYSVVGDSFSCANIDTLDAAKITTGTIAAARLPAGASYWAAATGGINYAGGNVGIGATTPAAKLDVSGSAKANLFYAHGTGEVTSNTAYGLGALNANTTGSLNTAVGVNALQTITTSSFNTGVGAYALSANTSGNANVAIGPNSLLANTTGSSNVAIGKSALAANTTGGGNMATGVSALAANTTAWGNTAYGDNALIVNTTGAQNVAVGSRALYVNTTASNNMAIGRNSLAGNTTGAGNVALGFEAGYTSTTANANVSGNYNTYIGFNAGPGTTTQLTNSAAIGANATVNVSNAIVLGDSTVSVGIGTSSPSKLLDVQGTASVVASFRRSDDDNSRYDILQLRRSRSSSTAPGSGFGSNITFRGEGFTNGEESVQAKVGAIWESNQTNDTTDRDGALVFSTALDDTVTERLRISSAGYIGIGNSNPTKALSVNGEIEALTVTVTTLAAASVNAGSFAVSSGNPGWVIGGLKNTAVDGYSGFSMLDNNNNIKGFMGYSNASAAVLPNSLFYTSEGAGVPLILGTNQTERVRITDTGVGVNGSNGAYVFYVNGTAGGTSAYVNASDRRLKKDITTIPNALERIGLLRGVTYNWNHDVHPELVLGHREEMGVIAQEVEKVFPDAVSEDKTNGIKSVAYTMLIAPLIEAVKTLNKMLTDFFSVSQKHTREIASVKSELNNKDQEIKKLQRENAEMKARLDRMEKMLMKK